MIGQPAAQPPPQQDPMLEAMNQYNMEVMGCLICQGQRKNWCPTHGDGSPPPVAPGEQPPRGRNWTGTCCENGNFGEPHICMKQRGDLPPNISELHGLLLSLDRLLTDPHPGLMTWREQYKKASEAVLAFYERPSNREEGKL